MAGNQVTWEELVYIRDGMKVGVCNREFLWKCEDCDKIFRRR